MGYVFIPRNWKRYIFHRGLSWTFQPLLGNGLFPGGKEKDRAVFQIPTNLFGNDPEEEEPPDDYTVPQKVPYVTRWKHDQDAAYLIRLSKAQDRGLEFWQTKSFAIMTHATILGDCIDRVTSQDADRVIFERLETPRPAPKVTLKKNWQSQQQQHSTSDTDVRRFWKQGTKRDHQAGAQDVTNHSTEADLAHRKLGHTTSNMDVDTHLGNKEGSTNALLESEAVKEEIAKTPTKAIERTNSVSNKICFREDLAKEKMMCP